VSIFFRGAGSFLAAAVLSAELPFSAMNAPDPLTDGRAVSGPEWSESAPRLSSEAVSSGPVYFIQPAGRFHIALTTWLDETLRLSLLDDRLSLCVVEPDRLVAGSRTPETPDVQSQTLAPVIVEAGSEVQ
jgi:hypothetical protein